MTSTPALDAPSVADLRARLGEVGLRDAHRLGRRLESAARLRHRPARGKALQQVAGQLADAERRLAARAAAVPAVTYPPQLPVSQRRDEIAAAIRDHQVVIVAGETGSGKTTQLPKICLELGRGVRGLIGHTQPRRLAARTVADRIAEELSTPLGEAVGYTVRFTDHVGPNTLVKLMTDGILLAEIQRDRDLLRYDTLIIDEAHERSLNIDFILGYVRQLLPRRPDLKVIITSATIETARFSEHFDDAPVIEVSGRTYPVQIRYRPIDETAGPDDASPATSDQIQAILDAVDELTLEGPGDILVFLSGEREIRDTADALRRHVHHRGALDPDLEILPLYARLSAAEQHRVFTAHPGRRVVLATNVAETSLTVPGIRYVVDPGTARISRYSHRLKVQRLPIEAISQASANQRAGRCGRVAEGVCIRLYSEEDFLGRPEFTEPEILRTNLASVILQMAALGLGDVAAFPFVEPPDRRNVRDGVQLLHELGALDPAQKDPRRQLTELGRRLAQLPIDPRFGRMILAAQDNGVAHEVLVIAAALSIQDPRERPAEHQQAADDKHRRFADETSDFLSYLALWDYVARQQKELSNSAFRRLCKAEFLHYLRVREWQDLYGQLREVARGLGLEVRASASAPTAGDRDPQFSQRLHSALLTGLLGHVGMRGIDDDRHLYLGARGAKFAIFPGSALFKKPPAWVVAAELVETSRLFARICARIEPEWVEPLAGHLVKRTYSEPHWERKRGAVMAYEKVTLYGVPLVAARKVGYGRIDPELSRELFIRNALVEGDWQTHHRFFHDNRALLADVEQLEHRARRRDIVVDDQALFDFYDERLPAEVVSGRHFDAWWKRARREQPDLLSFDRAMLVNEAAAQVDARDYPDAWRQGELTFRLTYQFEPGSDADGVTVHLPLDVLNRIVPAGFDWQIPGLRGPLVTALIRSLPKPIRRQLVPAPDHAAALLGQLPAGPETGRTDLPPLTEALADLLWRGRSLQIPPDAWDPSRVPDHLTMTFRVVDGGRTVAEGKELAVLQAQLVPQVREALSGALSGALAGALTPAGGRTPDTPGAGPGAGPTAEPETPHEVERTGLTRWPADTLPELPREVERRRGGRTLKGYPALVDEGDGVAVRVLESAAQQQRAMWAGCRRLLLLALAPPTRAAAQGPVKTVLARLDNRAKLALGHNPYGSVPRLLDDAVACAVDALMAAAGGPVWDAASFAALREAVRAELPDVAFEVVSAAAGILTLGHELAQRLQAGQPASVAASVDDARAQLAGLVHPGFLSAAGRDRLPDLLRYLQALGRRLDKLPGEPHRDAAQVARVAAVQAEYDQARAELPESRREDPDVQAVRWMLEELRVSLFAQPMRTAYPISEKRIYRALDALLDPAGG